MLFHKKVFIVFKSMDIKWSIPIVKGFFLFCFEYYPFLLSFNGVGYIVMDRFLHRGELFIVINLIS